MQFISISKIEIYIRKKIIITSSPNVIWKKLISISFTLCNLNKTTNFSLIFIMKSYITQNEKWSTIELLSTGTINEWSEKI